MNSGLQLDHLSKSLGTFSFRDISLEVNEGEYFVLLGPTGAGKTILLETIAGLHTPDSGIIYLKGRDISHLPPRKRQIGMVYQDLMLFPHLTVFENIAFGLRRQKVPFYEITHQVTEISTLFHIDSLLDRYPVTLSGGEQQRTAIARALVLKPFLLLLDEPLSALDTGTRMAMHAELRRIHQTFGTTILHITHHFEDVFALADRIAVMQEGTIEQIGKPEEVFSRPVNEFVAGFVGMGNIFRGQVEEQKDGLLKIRVGETLIIAIGEGNGEVLLTIRPEVIIISREPVHSSAQNCLLAIVTDIGITGPLIRITVDISVPLLIVLTRQSFSELEIVIGHKYYVTFKASSVHVIDN